MAHLRLNQNAKSKFKSRMARPTEKDFTPIHWDQYFSSFRDIDVNGDTFRVYMSGTSGPVIVLLHGGGYSGLTWALFAKELTSRVKCKVLALDLRGHGETHTIDEDNLAIERMTRDILSIIAKMITEDDYVVFIGHSMGGALAVHCALEFENAAMLVVIDVVEGTAMDSLTSMQSFLRGRPNSFQSVENAIHWCFYNGQTHNLEAARVSMPGQIKNIQTNKLAASEIGSPSTEQSNEQLVEEAGASTSGIIPLNSPLIVPPEETQHANMFEGEVSSTQGNQPLQMPVMINPYPDILNEENEESEESEVSSTTNLPEENTSQYARKPPLLPNRATQESAQRVVANFRHPDLYTWRINLSRTEKYWRGWFKGLSQSFLDCQVPKLLILANIQGLDTTLTIGQMQGKFQLQVLPRSGHAIHEDLPDKVADVIATFLLRHRFTTAEGNFAPIFPAC